MDLAFLHRTNLAPHIWSFSFQPLQPIEYLPGQYADFSVSNSALKTIEQPYRTFTLTSHPADSLISFITRLDPPLSPHKQHLYALQPGDTMHMTNPMGDAVLPRITTTPLIFAAQGIALASYLSMLTECARSHLAHHIVLLWVRRSADDPLETLIPGKVPHLTRVDLRHPERLPAAEIVPHLQSNSLVYLSGSQTFVETLGAGLETAGIPRARLIYDYYSGYAEL